MKLMADELRHSGKEDKQIIEINFESMRFSEMTVKEFYDYIADRIVPEKRMYFFFDEVQRIVGWENAVNSFRVDFDCDIYITGSNAHLLSQSYPLTLPVGMWRSRCCRFLSGSFWISTDIG